jgi:4-amino-4-deoxy-L-arabinose transferase-like glycosyltransferase
MSLGANRKSELSTLSRPEPTAPQPFLDPRGLLYKPLVLIGLALLIGAALRLWFLFTYPMVAGDSLVYGDIAKNWMLHGIYGRHTPTGIHPTLLRLPGYPLFLAACFWLFHIDHYNAVAFVQIAIDMCGCLILAALATRIWSRKAGWWTLWLSCLCPFTANYAAIPLTETLELFSITVSLYAFVRFISTPQKRWLFLIAAAWSYAALLRPDGPLLAVAFCPALYFYGRQRWGARRMLRSAVIAGLLSIIPFTPWTIRNWNTFHVLEPLAPRYAVDPGQSTNPGFNHWTRAICVDFACTEDIYWNGGSDEIDPSTLPARAFPSPAVRAATLKLLADYNRTKVLTPSIDARFGALAARIRRAHPVQYYVELPLARLADMWLRPRTEMLWVELRWWQYSMHPGQTIFAVAYVILNLAFLLAALRGIFKHPPFWGAMLAFALLRCALLVTLEAPEPRYTLECFPMIFVLSAIAFTQSDARLSDTGTSHG